MKSTTSHWSLQLYIPCPHCEHQVDFLDSEDYYDGDGWDKLPEDALGAGSFETTCESCDQEFEVKVDMGL